MIPDKKTFRVSVFEADNGENLYTGTLRYGVHGLQMSYYATCEEEGRIVKILKTELAEALMLQLTTPNNRIKTSDWETLELTDRELSAYSARM